MAVVPGRSISTVIAPRAHPAYRNHTDSVREFLEKNPQLKYVDKEVFYSCFHEIKPWIDLSILIGYLMKYDLVQSSDDMYILTSSFFPPQDKFNSLVKTVEAAGQGGFMLLYICLKESASETRGHEAAAVALENCAAQKSLDPPWRNFSSSMNQGVKPIVAGVQDLRISLHKNIDSPISKAIESLEIEIARLAASFLEELVKSQINTKEICDRIFFLPYKLKRELSYPISERADDLRKKKTLHQLFTYLDGTIWNFIDYELLEHLIYLFGSDALRREMQSYTDRLQMFKSRTTISQLIEFWPGRKEVPLTYSEMTAKADLDPNECTLEKLNSVRKELRENFLPPLSEYALLHFKFNQGSVVVTWLIPNDLVPHFTNKICSRDSAVQLMELRISMLWIQGIVVYPISVNEGGRIVTDDYHVLTHKTFEFQVILNSLQNSPEILALNDKMKQITSQATELLQSKSITPNKLVRIFPKLPQKLQFEYLVYLRDTLMANSYGSSSQDLFSCIHFGLVKVSIDIFGSKELKHDVDKIEQELLALRSKVTAEDYMDCDSHTLDESLPSDYGNLEFQINKEPEICTLQNLEDIRAGFSDEFMPKVDKNLIFLRKIGRGSTIVVLAVPKQVVREVNVLVREDNDRRFFEEHGIVSLSIEKKLAYSNDSPPAILTFSHCSNSILDISHRHSPSITLNNHGWLIQTYKDQHTQISFYRIGKARKLESDIQWHCEERVYDSGKCSQISMNDDCLIVEVFQSHSIGQSQCCYRIGFLNLANGTINWEASSEAFASGQHPCVAVNNHGIIVVAFERGLIRKDLFYRVGDFSVADRAISWRQDEAMFLKDCSKPSVSLTDWNTVVFSFTSTTCNSFITGHVNPYQNLGAQSVLDPVPERNRTALILKPISDEESKQRLPEKYRTVVAANRYGHLISVRIISTNVVFYTGRLDHDHTVTVSSLHKSSTHYNSKEEVLSPSIAINASNLVVFTCHTSSSWLLRGTKAVSTSLGHLIPESTS